MKFSSNQRIKKIIILNTIFAIIKSLEKQSKTGLIIFVTWIPDVALILISFEKDAIKENTDDHIYWSYRLMLCIWEFIVSYNIAKPYDQGKLYKINARSLNICSCKL